MSSASTTIPTTNGFTESAFEAFLKHRDEPAWLIDRRRAAFAQFQASPWPTSRDEEWRRTDIRALKLGAFAPPTDQEPSAQDREAIEPFWKTLSAHYGTGIAQINGTTVRSADPKAVAGAVF